MQAVVLGAVTLLECVSCDGLWVEDVSGAVGAPSGTSGSGKTRARRISSSVGAAENTGRAGGDDTDGTVRLVATAGAAMRRGGGFPC